SFFASFTLLCQGFELSGEVNNIVAAHNKSILSLSNALPRSTFGMTRNWLSQLLHTSKFTWKFCSWRMLGAPQIGHILFSINCFISMSDFIARLNVDCLRECKVSSNRREKFLRPAHIYSLILTGQ